MRVTATIGLLAVTGFLAACADTSAPGDLAQAPQGARVIPGQYIVVYRDNVADAAATTKQLFSARGIAPLYEYDAALRGAAVRISDSEAAALRENPNVLFVEPDQEYSIQVTQTIPASGDPWGIDRIDQRNLPLSRTYTYTTNGAGVRVYIIDTGIQTSHSQFGGRASAVYDAFGGSGQDCHGHGTHVADAAGAVLSQAAGSETERVQKDALTQRRQVDADSQAERAAGIGQTEQDQESSERDADGRRLWEGPAAAAKDKKGGETTTAAVRQSKDATGQSGTQLDLTG